MLDKQGKKLRVSDIAELAGVSPTAVSRYLNSSGYLSPEKGEAIRRALEAMGAQTDESAPENRGRSRKLFAFLAPPHSLPGSMQFAAMGSVFSEEARSKGYATKVYSMDLSGMTLSEALRQVLAGHPNGIMIPVVPMMTLDIPTQRFIQECEVPIVMCSEFPTPYPTIHSIIYSFGTGLDLSVTHLIEMGCRRLALLTPPNSQSKSAGLQQTAFFGCTGEKKELENAQCFTYPWVDGKFAQAGYACAKEAFSQNPDLDGIISWTDSYAAGILWYLYEVGKQVPRDVKLVALHEDYAPYLCPPLTTYTFSNREVCVEAVEMLVTLQSPRQRQNIRHLYINPIFTVRGSTDPEKLPARQASE